MRSWHSAATGGSLRILLVLVEPRVMHFEPGGVKAGNAPPLTDGDVVFPDLLLRARLADFSPI